ncbi:uncharacterized protein LOC121920948 [Sceloporus undulatus]|uniref:uncharacterized protein LOC121920948 n=1 Tax=Sceloporus undulatus TaxID=8520 RepID=UPI001C4B7B3B|nr:uncharacterized protein LOC121920948 [Sceloporus undulatus]
METRESKRRKEREEQQIRTEKMAKISKGSTQSQLLLTTQRRGSMEDSIKIIDPNIRILDEIRKLQQEMKEARMETKEDIRTACAELREEIKDTRAEIRKDVKKELEIIGKKMDKLTTDLNKTQKEVEQIKERTNILEKSSKELNKQQEEQKRMEWNNELRYREKCIKLRGLTEKSKEDLYERLIPALARYVDITPEEMEMEIDKMFRINSPQNKDRNVSRDVAICFARTKVRDRFIQQSYENKLWIEDMEIKIFKDIPPQIMMSRQKYKPLTRLLKNINIDFRWDRIEGLSFFYQQRRYKIDTIDKANEIEMKLRKEYKENGGKRDYPTKEWRASKNNGTNKEKTVKELERFDPLERTETETDLLNWN